MTMRSGWTKNGKHFAETTGINGRTLYFIDGKITKRADWLAALKAADADKAKAAKAA